MSRPGREPPARTTSGEPWLAEPSVSSPPKLTFLAELPVLMLFAFGLALLLKTFIVQAFFIPSRSMEPTLLVGDRVLVNKVVYELRDPKRGEVVVFTHPDEDAPAQESRNLLERLLRSLGSGLGLRPGERDFIKRVIALPGDTVEINNGIVYVNGQPLPEGSTSQGGYLSARDRTDFRPVKVRPGHYFMMGDNRPNSDDSRGSLGQIARQEIVGRAFVIVWPFPHAGTLPRPDYGAILGGSGLALASSVAVFALPSGVRAP